MKHIIFTLALLFSVTLLHAQRENYNWVFGNVCAVTFNTPDQSPKNFSPVKLSTVEGTASISDKNGNLLLYTDGIYLYNGKNQAITSNLEGNYSSTQSALILPDKNLDGIYYVFVVGTLYATTTPNVGLFYAVVDINAANGAGTITKHIRINDFSNEKLTAVDNDSHDGFWIICANNLTGEYYSYLLTDGSLSSPVISASVSGKLDGGYLRVNTKGSMIASVEKNINSIAVYHFDRKSGKLTPKNFIHPETDDIFKYFYGLEFSPNDRFLYTTLESYKYNDTLWPGTALIQFDLNFENDKDIWDNKSVIYNTIYDKSNSEYLSALALGPNGKIYAAQFDSQYLGVINNPDEKGNGCNFAPRGFHLTAICQFGLPNFLKTNCPDAGVPERDTIWTCKGEPVTIGVDNDTNFTYRWAPAVGLSDDKSSLTTAVSDTSIVYTLYRNDKQTGCLFMRIFSVNISPFDPGEPVRDTVWTCKGEPVTIGVDNDTNFTYRWAPAVGLSDDKSSLTTAVSDTSIVYTLYRNDKQTGCLFMRIFNVNISPFDPAKILSHKIDQINACLNSTTMINLNLSNISDSQVFVDSVEFLSKNELKIADFNDMEFAAGESKNLSISIRTLLQGSINDTIIFHGHAPCSFVYRVPLTGDVSVPQLTFWTFDSLTVPQNNFCIPIFAKYQCNGNDSTTISYKMKIKISKQLFKPVSVESGNIDSIYEENGSFVVDISDSNVMLAGDSEQINELCGIIYVGNIEQSDIQLSDFSSDNSYSTDLKKGSLAIDVCANNLRQVILTETTEMTIVPNPVADMININLSSEEEGDFSLKIVDGIGDIVWQSDFVIKEHGKFQKSIQIPTSNMGNGVYSVLLSHPRAIESKRVVVER